jgi:formamidopyrimidine-DNA glycosylase
VPELPDVELYLHCLRPRVVDVVLERVTIANPFVLRSVDPPVDALEGRPVRTLTRLGKRIVMHFDEELALIVHLMIAGRLLWHPADGPAPSLKGRQVVAAFRFATGTLVLTEAGTKKRASVHVVRGADALAAHDRGGLEVLDCDAEAFGARLRSERHTLKRALTDPRLFSGIGGAYADEILHRARLSPLGRSDTLDDATIAALHAAAQATLSEWTTRLCTEVGDGFPKRGSVTAFRPEMSVHGRFGQPCPDCGTPVQRIVYAERETNYCPGCQTGGRVLADRSLSRLLRDDWPRTVEALEDGPA